MSILGKSKLQTLLERSEKTFSIFEKTKNDIVTLNSEIGNEEKVRLDAIELLNSELTQLNDQKAKNNKVLENINKFFS